MSVWGHDWVILSLLIGAPAWSPTKVWALPVGIRLSRNHQGVTKGNWTVTVSTIALISQGL